MPEPTLPKSDADVSIMMASINAVLARYNMEVAVLMTVGRETELPTRQHVVSLYTFVSPNQIPVSLLPHVTKLQAQIIAGIQVPPLRGMSTVDAGQIVFPTPVIPHTQEKKP